MSSAEETKQWEKTVNENGESMWIFNCFLSVCGCACMLAWKDVIWWIDFFQWVLFKHAGSWAGNRSTHIALGDTPAPSLVNHCNVFVMYCILKKKGIFSYTVTIKILLECLIGNIFASRNDEKNLWAYLQQKKG